MIEPGKGLKYLALTLLALTAGGCITFPLPSHAVENTEDLSAKIGKADSKKPIRIDVTSQNEIEDLLGPPIAFSADGSHLLYFWRYCDGFRWAPLTLTYFDSVTGTMWLDLTCDAQLILRSATPIQEPDPERLGLISATYVVRPKELQAIYPGLEPYPNWFKVQATATTQPPSPDQ